MSRVKRQVRNVADCYRLLIAAIVRQAIKDGAALFLESETGQSFCAIVGIGEQWREWVDRYKSEKHAPAIRPRHKMSEAAKRKISELNKGRNKGKKVSEETRQKMREAARRRWRRA